MRLLLRRMHPTTIGSNQKMVERCVWSKERSLQRSCAFLLLTAAQGWRRVGATQVCCAWVVVVVGVDALCTHAHVFAL